MRVFVLKLTGNLPWKSNLKFVEILRFLAEAHFFIPGMPADFNRTASELIAWLADTSLPLQIEWRDDV
jgi:hypothetical protein